MHGYSSHPARFSRAALDPLFRIVPTARRQRCYRSNQTLLNTAIQNLEAAQQSTHSADNTPAAQQNITNGILLQLLKLQQSAASLHAVVTERLAAANSWQRNTAADNLTMLPIQSRNTAPADYAHTA